VSRSGSERAGRQFVQHTVTGAAPLALPCGVPPVGAPQVTGVGVPGEAIRALAAPPTQQLVPSSGVVPSASLLKQPGLPKSSTIGVQVPGVALQLQAVQLRPSLMEP
jgi:hypothetical protein